MLKKVNVIIADDNNFITEALKFELSKYEEYNVIHNASTSIMLENILKHEGENIDVIISDIAMPDKDKGLQLKKHIKSSYPNTKLISLSEHNDYTTLVYLLKINIDGYINKKFDKVNDVSKALHYVIRDEKYYNEDMKRVYTIYSKNQLILSELKKSDTEIIKYITKDFNNKKIAQQLNKSVETIKKRKQYLRRLLNVNGPAGFTRFAYRSGLINIHDYHKNN